MKLKRPSNTSIYETTNFHYKGTYEELRKSRNIQSLSQTQKGHITCWLKEYNVFVVISPNGKLIIYYDRQNDHNNAIRLLLGSDKKLIVCDNFELIQDVPRTLQSMQEGIEAVLKDLIDPDLILRLNYDNYILPTAPPKTYKAVGEGIRNYLTGLLERCEYSKAVEEMENTNDWVITFGMEVTEEILPDLDYVQTCDELTKELTSALEKSPYSFRLYEDDRDGEGISLRYVFLWRPADGPLKLPEFPYGKHWERLELAPFKEIYPDSDIDDIYNYSDSD